MIVRDGTRPGRPLDDDWLFSDPMTIELAGRFDAERCPLEAAVGRARRPRWRYRLLASILIVAAGSVAVALLTGGGQDRLGVSAAACLPAPAARAAVAAPVPGRSG
jgi:hypothetical protein